MPYFFILFVLYALLEFSLMSSFIDAVGFFWALVEIIVTIFIGSAVVRKQFQNIAGLSEERAVHIEDILMAIIGGVFLMIPGLFTDFIGVMMGWSFFREKMAELFTRTGAMDYTEKTIFKDRFDNTRSKTGSQQDNNSVPPVIDGDFREVDDDKK